MNAVNLLPTEQRITESRSFDAGPVTGWFVLATLGIALAGIVLHTTTGNDIDRLRADVATATAQGTATQAAAARLAPAREFATTAQAKTDGVRGLAASRFAWDRTMEDLALALPAGARLTELEASVAPGSGGGSAVRAALPVPAIVVRGCVGRQRQIPDLLSRLSDVKGATRAVLGSSEAPETEGGDGQEAGPCGSGPAPDFEVTVFFGGAATAADADADPAATPTPGAPA